MGVKEGAGEGAGAALKGLDAAFATGFAGAVIIIIIIIIINLLMLSFIAFVVIIYLIMITYGEQVWQRRQHEHLRRFLRKFLQMH